LGWLDISIIVLYLLFISWRGFSKSQTHNTTTDFFLANRSLSWPVIGLSLFATNISTSSIIGLASSGYKTGISVFDYEWTGSIMLVIFAIFIIPFYLNYQLTTMPEYLERRFDQRSRVFFAFISIIINIFIDISGALYASSLFLEGLFPHVNSYIFIISLAIIAGLYTISGGLRAVITTDSIQAMLITSGSIIVTFIAFWHVGSWHHLTTALDHKYLSLIRPANDSVVPWPTLLISMPILGFYFMCTNQYMVQRVLSARSVDDGRKGALFAALLKLSGLFIFVLPGTLARIIFPHISDSNLVFPKLVYKFLPPGILGFVMTAFIAALMSSIDSALSASSSIATMDIYKNFRPESSQSHLVKVGKIFIIIAVLMASLWAPFITRFHTLWTYLQAVLSYLSPPVASCFLLGLVWQKASSDGAYYALWGGSIAAVILVINNYFLPFMGSIHYLYSATIIFVFSSLIMIVVSLMRPDDKSFKHMHKWFEDMASPAGQVWYRSYNLFAVVVCLLTAAIVIAFW